MGEAMYARVVRFTDVKPERIAEIEERAKEAGGPPEGVPSTGIQILVDESQQTAVVVQLFDTEEDMLTGEKALEQMDASETPGTRASVDKGEVKLDLKAG
jgi:hypothetical protein